MFTDATAAVGPQEQTDVGSSQPEPAATANSSESQENTPSGEQQSVEEQEMSTEAPETTPPETTPPDTTPPETTPPDTTPPETTPPETTPPTSEQNGAEKKKEVSFSPL